MNSFISSTEKKILPKTAVSTLNEMLNNVGKTGQMYLGEVHRKNRNIQDLMS